MPTGANLASMQEGNLQILEIQHGLLYQALPVGVAVAWACQRLVLKPCTKILLLGDFYQFI